MKNKQLKIVHMSGGLVKGTDILITREQYMKIQTVHAVMVLHFGEEFLVSGRRYINVERRMMFCRIVYETIAGITLEQIGGYIGRDHATVIHLIRRCKELCDIYSRYRKDYEQITARVSEEFELLDFGVLAQPSYEI